MNLSKEDSKKIVETAKTFLGQKYTKNFTCTDFIREVYKKVGINFPIIAKLIPPPKKFNLSAQQIENPPIGHSFFLKRKALISPRPWSHAAIVISATECIHCSRHFGGKVTVTPIKELLEFYKLSN